MTKTESYDRISELSKLNYDNWDGYNAFAIEELSVKRLKDIVDKLSDNDLKDWIIFPGKYGGFNFERRNKELSCIIVNRNNIIYVIADEIDGKVEKIEDNNFEYSLDRFIETLNKINSYYKNCYRKI